MAMVEVTSFSEGIWIFWDREVDFHVIESYNQVVHGVCKVGTLDEWRLSIVYGYPQFQRRRELWEQLNRIEVLGISRWCFCGYFNVTLHVEDRVSTAKKSAPPDRWFKE